MCKMRNLKLFGLVVASGLVLASCRKDKKDDGPIIEGPKGEVTLKGDITKNRTLSADTIYHLSGFVYVKNSVTLTIQPGTLITSTANPATNDFPTLVISRGAMIQASGTAQKPIVFTSGKAAGARAAGDWGGIIILGKAPINRKGSGSTATFNENKIEGGLIATAGGSEYDYYWYGGTDAADNSGVLKYVRIEYPGVPFSVDNEINGLTLGGVGSGTTMDHVEIFNSGDDAFEWFGGTVNAKYLIAINSVDDDFDTDFGFSGKVQFAFNIRNANIADKSGSNGFESDNDGDGSANSPQTKAMFSNVTVLGPLQTPATTINTYFQNAAQIRRNSSESISNSIFVGFPVGLYIDDTKGSPTSANAVAGNLVFKNNIIAGCTTPFKTSAAFDIATFITGGTNTTLANVADAGLTDPYATSPKLTLKSSSVALTGAAFAGGYADAYFTQVAYKGAFDATTDWTSGWANWNPLNTEY